VRSKFVKKILNAEGAERERERERERKKERGFKDYLQQISLIIKKISNSS